MPALQLDSVSLEDLRRRRSAKWTMFPADVLPSFYAEMDFPLAAAIAAVLRDAIADGDLGYARAEASGARDGVRRLRRAPRGTGRSTRRPSWPCPT